MYRVFRTECQDANRTLEEALKIGQSIEQVRFPFGGILPDSFRYLVSTERRVMIPIMNVWITLAMTLK